MRGDIADPRRGGHQAAAEAEVARLRIADAEKLAPNSTVKIP